MKQSGGLSPVILVSIGLLGVAARAQTPVDAPAIKPIDSLWLASPPVFPSTSERDAAYTRGLKQWRQVFDAYILIKLPPTFSDEENFTVRAKTLIKEVGGEFIVVTLPVGTEGWESSANQRFAEKHGWHYDTGKAMSQTQWLATLKGLDSGTWEWVLEGAAQMPTPEQAARSASEFVKYAKSQHKKAVIWLSGEGFAIPRFKAMIERICEATRDDADFFGWMDLPSTIALKVLGHKPTSAEEARMSPAMLEELSKALDTRVRTSNVNEISSDETRLRNHGRSGNHSGYGGLIISEEFLCFDSVWVSCAAFSLQGRRWREILPW